MRTSMIKSDSFKQFKEFFKYAPHDDSYACFGLCYTLGRERIGPGIWNKQFIANCCTRVEEIDYHYWLLEDADGLTLTAFLPLKDIFAMTEEIYKELLCNFELEIKKVKEQLKLEDLQNDF